MNNTNFHQEFREITDSIITRYMDENNLELPLQTYLRQKSYDLKKKYNNWRESGLSLEECTIRLQTQLLPEATLEECPSTQKDIRAHYWYKSLKHLSGQLLFHICNQEQLRYLLPLIKRCNRPVILLTESKVDETKITENYITIMEIDFIPDLHLYYNPFMEANFPRVYAYYNTFTFLMEVLNPEGVIYVESDQYPPQILSLIAQEKEIPCLCMQQDVSVSTHSSSQKVHPVLFSGTEKEEDLQKISDYINQTTCCHYLKENKDARLHIGSGWSKIEGWLNVDFVDHGGTYYLDAGRNYPFPDNSFNYIFSEHLFEHLTLTQGITMLKECYRILKPGGKKRLAMPDLNFLIDLYLHPEKEINQQYLQWSTPAFVPEIKELYEDGNYPPIYAFNNFFHAWGHQFIHTFEEFVTLATHVGFKNIKRCSVGKSKTPVFLSIERHTNSIPSWANELETVVIEMEK